MVNAAEVEGANTEFSQRSLRGVAARWVREQADVVGLMQQGLKANAGLCLAACRPVVGNIEIHAVEQFFRSSVKA